MGLRESLLAPRRIAKPLIIMQEGQGVVMADALLTQSPAQPYP